MKLIYTTLLLLLMLPAGATIRYVRAGAAAGGNGLSWATAYNNLETALNAAVANTDEVWVSEGTYSPTGTGTFTIKNGIKVLGGFPATGNPALSDTNWRVNKTYLQKATANNPIVTMSGATSINVFCGFYIINGNSSGNAGGMYLSGNGSVSATPFLQNLLFDRCVATYSGGGIFMQDVSPIIVNAVFQNCKAQYGGGLATADAAPDVRRCAFDKDTATTDGGSIYYNGTPASGVHGVFTDVVAYGGYAGRAAGGAALQGDNTQPKFLNCTFVNNYSVQNINNTGGAIYTYSGSTTNAPAPVITNCLFFGNANSQGLLDIGANRATNNISYSYYAPIISGPGVGAGNVLSTTTAPFNNISVPKGADGLWLTADDGLIPSICTGKMVIDKGNNTAISYIVDAAYQPRNRNVSFIADGGLGTTPIIDMGAYENQTATTVDQIAGSIQGKDTIPSPQELVQDTIKSVVAPMVVTGRVIQWQSKTGTGNWQPAPLPNDKENYYFNTLAQTTLFRRAVWMPQVYCDTLYSAEMEMYVYPVNAADRIKGQVKSKGGGGVEGVKITVTRRGTNTPGSPAGYSYPPVYTDGQGNYSLTGIYLGPNNTSSDSFYVVPELAGHRIVRNNPDSATRISVTLKRGDAQKDTVNFTDVTVFSLLGKTYQRCIGCNDANGILMSTLTCPLEGVKVVRGLNTRDDSTVSTLVAGQAVYGLSIQNTGTYTFRPSYRNHLFAPASRQLYIGSDVSNQDFEDTTTHVISGRLAAGCSEGIGTAVLEFSDVFADSNRVSCFRKRDTTTSTGYYDIRLPAGKYKVRVISFTPNAANGNIAFVEQDVLRRFFNENTPADSLTKDINLADAVLNLVYIRSPVLVITRGLDTICASGVNRHYAIFRQALDDSFQVKIFQGSPLLRNGLGCQLKDTTNPLIVSTSVHKKDMTVEDLPFGNGDTSIMVRLTGGTPYTVGSFYKPLSIRYTDVYGRVATPINKNVVVTGVKPDAGATFTTVSPQIPLMVLHDPPGDMSSSAWTSAQKRETAFRMYAETGLGIKAWREVKLGTKQEVEIFGVGTEFEAWGKVKTTFAIDAASKTGNELILSTSAINRYETSTNPSVNGADGDVFIGTALNLICIGSDVLTYDGCQVNKTRELMVSNGGFAPNTDYVFTQLQILSNTIPGLQQLALAKPDSAAYYNNQIKVWQQLLDNNRKNKERAKFDKNVSFGGSIGSISSSTTSSLSTTNTIEFKVAFSAALATDLGFEIAGSGASTGLDLDMKMEVGTSIENNITREETLEYKLADQNILDEFNVNIKKDPVYGTPVFDLVGGKTSCPVEPGSYPRDQFEIYAPVSTIENVPTNGTATFALKLANTNAYESRYYYLTFEQVSNPYGARIEVGGSPYVGPIYYIIPPASEIQVIVNVTRPVNSNVYSFNDLQFSINDSCYRVSKTTSLNARFQNPCSGITIGSPESNWLVNTAANNTLPVLLKDYTKYGLSSIRLEYASANTSVWNTAITKQSSELNDDSTTLYWHTDALAEGTYKIRVAVNCPQATSYTASVAGLIDRQAPNLFGRPEPTNDRYVRGDQIIYSYDEKLDNTNLNNGRVTLDKRSNNQFVPLAVNVSGYDNRIIVTPTLPIYNTPGDTMRVVVRGMKDVYGNTKLQPDTSFFIIGNSPIDTSNRAMTVSIANATISKTSDSVMLVTFKLPVISSRNVRVNFAIGGTARYGIDYITEYATPQPPFAFFNGLQGAAQIDSSNNQVILRIRSIDTSFNSNKTISIYLSEGGDYGFGATTAVTGTLLNEDGISSYTFTGNGNFNVRSNWLNNRMPLTTLAPGKSIFINPSGTCTLNVPLTIRPGASLRVMLNKNFIIPGNLKFN